jgi:hypothetical protein
VEHRTARDFFVLFFIFCFLRQGLPIYIGVERAADEAGASGSRATSLRANGVQREKGQGQRWSQRPGASLKVRWSE